MATQAAADHEHLERPVCWCCDGSFDERDLSRLGSHPEVAVCAGCAQWLHRRARSAAEEGDRTPGAVLRRSIATVRERVVRAGAQDWPLVGSLLRRLDRRLP